MPRWILSLPSNNNIVIVNVHYEAQFRENHRKCAGPERASGHTQCYLQPARLIPYRERFEPYYTMQSSPAVTHCILAAPQLFTYPEGREDGRLSQHVHTSRLQLSLQLRVICCLRVWMAQNE
jgi:hypothetical protein